MDTERDRSMGAGMGTNRRPGYRYGCETVGTGMGAGLEIWVRM